MGLILSFSIFLSAVVIHEFSHAYVAHRLGDPTAKNSGRLTLNPLAHIDPFGTILLPLMLVFMRSPVLFGWAKPVPVNFSNLGNPKRDMIWVGLAGPAANLLCATLVSLYLNIGLSVSPFATGILTYLAIINVVLAVFNLVPIPPLDGSRILMGLLPRPMAIQYAKLGRYGFIVLIALLYMGFFERLIWPLAGLILSLLSIV